MEHIPENILQGNRLLTGVKEGMKVYDPEDHAIGRVERVYLGVVSQEEAETGTGAATSSSPGLSLEENDPLDFAFGGVLDKDVLGNEEHADVLRNRLMREGFIEVDTSGIFSSDVYVLPDQIESVSGDRLKLKVKRDSLIKGK